MKSRLLSCIALSLLLTSGAASAQKAPVAKVEEIKTYTEKTTKLKEKGSSHFHSRNYTKDSQYVSHQYLEKIIVNTDTVQKGTAVLYFDFDSEHLPYRAKKVIDSFVETAPPGTEFRVEASADFLGSKEYNDVLSKRRADNIANYIMQKDGYRVSAVVGLGKKEAKRQKGCKKENKDALRYCIAEDRFGLITYTSK